MTTLQGRITLAGKGAPAIKCQELEQGFIFIMYNLLIRNEFSTTLPI